MTELQTERGSFRDRHGRVVYADGRVLRGISEQALAHWQQLESSRFFTKAMDNGSVVRTHRVADDDPVLDQPDLEAWAAVLEHQRIGVISYPYEWTFSMLKDAALLQLELLAKALNQGMILKDSSAFNIQFDRGRPVFIDIPSFEKLEPGESWVGYRQFCQLFLYPLMLQAYKQLHFQPLLRGSIDGITPEVANSIFSVRDRFRSGVFSHVYLQAKLNARYAGTSTNVRQDLKRAGFGLELIKANVARLRKLVSGMEWQPAGSEWGEYSEFHNYSDDDHQLKEQFVADAVADSGAKTVWDIGCNTGQFSRIAAKHADQVVAMDADHLAVEKLYRSLKADGDNRILPLVMNLADPSPGLGWRGEERKPLAQRAAPDLVLCLALIHHVVISANIPVDEFVQWLADLGADLVIEFVSKDDDKVKTLLRNKADQYSDYELDYFELCLQKHFDIQRRIGLNSDHRQLYFCSARKTGS